MAFTLDQIKQYAANPSTIPGGGSYGEGAAYNLAAMFPVLKQAVQSGQLSLTEYQGLAEPLAKAGQNLSHIAGQGSKQANAVNGALSQLQPYIDFGKGTFTMPFSKQEYAKLPDSVLPTQNDINSGMFDPTGAPLQRVQPAAPTPAVNPGPGTPATPATPGTPTPANGGNNATTTPGTPTPNTQTGTAPIYTAAPNNPPPYGGLASTSQDGSFDAQRIAQEGALQQQLSTQNQEGITAKRQQYLNDLSTLLVQQQQQQMSQDAPGIYEDLNSRGLLRSSELGNAMGREAANLQAKTTNQLAQYGVQGETSDLGNYQTIQNAYNDSRNTALNREFSVEDYNKQVQTGKDLGAQYASLTPGKVNSGKGAQIGTAVGGISGAFAGGPTGAMAGAQIGGAAGGAASGGKG